MKKIIIVLGSNHEQEKNVGFAMNQLSQNFPGVRFSRLLWTEPIGMENSPQFVNALAIAFTDLPEPDIVHILKDIERQCGRTKEEKKQGIVKLDLDLLLYGDLRRKEEDWERDYVKQLLGEMGE